MKLKKIKQNLMFGKKYVSGIEVARSLKECKNIAMVRDINDLDVYRKRIKDYEEKG